MLRHHMLRGNAPTLNRRMLVPGSAEMLLVESPQWPWFRLCLLMPQQGLYTANRTVLQASRGTS